MAYGALRHSTSTIATIRERSPAVTAGVNIQETTPAVAETNTHTVLFCLGVIVTSSLTGQWPGLVERKIRLFLETSEADLTLVGIYWEFLSEGGAVAWHPLITDYFFHVFPAMGISRYRPEHFAKLT